MFVSVLGPVRIVVGGNGHTISSARRRHLLAALTASVGASVSTDRLTQALWGDEPPPSAPAALQVHVSDVRSLLDPDRPARQDGGGIVTEPEGYRLDLRVGQLDWTRARALADAGHGLRAEGRHAEARAVLAEALRRWDGPAYADAREPVRAHAQWLDDTRLDVEDDLVAAALASGEHAWAAAEAARLTAEQPFRERRAALLVLAHYRSGRQREALEAYEAIRARLQDEVGCAPGPELVTLHRAVLDHDPALSALTLALTPGDVPRPAEAGDDLVVLEGDDVGLAVAEAVLWSRARVVQRDGSRWTFRGEGAVIAEVLDDEGEHPGSPVAALATPTARRVARPSRPPEELVGRDREVAAVRAALARHPVVSVVGPPGVGTSSVALAAVGDRPIHRVVLPRSDESVDLLGALADAAGVRRHGHTHEQLREELPGRVVLVDGADGDPVQVGRLVEVLGEAADGLLLTGRSRLGLAGEEVVEVPPLEGPDAVALLARRVGAEPEVLGPGEDVAALAAHLGGLPLAIELLAPAVRALGATAVLTRLEGGPGLWHAGPAAGPDLGEAIAWSWNRLPDDAARLLARSSVFADRFTLEDLEAAATDEALPADRVAPALAALVDASLVAPRRDVDGLTYEVYAVVRAFAREELQRSGEEGDARRRHAAHVARSLARSGRGTGRPGVAAAQRRIERSRRDLDLAVQWLESAGVVDEHLDLAAGLSMFWFSTGRLREGRQFAQRALARGGTSRPRARCLTTAGFLAWFQGDYPAVAALLAEASELTGDRHPSALRLVLEAALALVGGDLDAADRAATEGLDRARRERSEEEVAVAATMAGTVAWYQGRAGDAVDHFREAAEIGARAGLPLLTALARRGQALNLAGVGQLDEARRVAALARADGERLGDPVNRGQAVAFVGLVELAAGADAEAEVHLREAVTISAPAFELFGLFLEVSGLLVLAGRREDHTRVLELDGWISATVEGLGMPLPSTHQAERRDAVEAAEAALGEDRASSARHRGRSLRPEDLAGLVGA